MSSRFRPWRAEFYYSVVLAGLSATMLYQAARAGFTTTGAWGLLLAIFLGVGSRLAWLDGHRRWYGAALEEWAINRVTPLLKRKGLGVRSNVRVPGLGDADLVVASVNSEKVCVIEIKAYGKQDGRTHAAVEQVGRLQARLGATSAVVWLPRAESSWLDWLRRGEPGQALVVKGDAKKLAKVVTRSLN